jgi:hypothetical protein
MLGNIDTQVILFFTPIPKDNCTQFAQIKLETGTGERACRWTYWKNCLKRGPVGGPPEKLFEREGL